MMRKIILRHLQEAAREFRSPNIDNLARIIPYTVAIAEIIIGIILGAYCIYLEFYRAAFFVGFTFVLGGMSGAVLLASLKGRSFKDILNTISKGGVLDVLLPPEEADHRILELDVAMERWIPKYGPKRAQILYAWQSIISVALFWFDRVVVKVLARK